MASGYVTSDGKDLDSRYLAIGGKAASASTADTATKANSVAWSAVSGKPSIPSNVVRNGAVIKGTVRSNDTYSVPRNGFCFADSGYVRLNGSSVATDSAFELSDGHIFFVQSGEKITTKGETVNYVIIPIKCS